jgi:acyl-coenzyme A synthetase/AMP-(fatty) acid ligase
MVDILPLGQWLSASRSAGHLVAFEGDKGWTQEMLQRDVHRLYGELRHRPGERWALCFDNGYRFLVALLATLHAGKTPVLPGHCREAQLREQHTFFSGVIADQPFLLDCPVIVPDGLACDLDITLPPVPDCAGVVLFTSGSTGQPTQIFKTVRALDEESAWLAALWGKALANCRVVASVSHQHMYGLTFRIMLPMTLGLPCDTAMLHFPEQLSARRGFPLLFISSPAFLKRLDNGLTAPPCRMTISAAGKLDDDTAQRAGEWLGEPVCEIYGTTETGVLAWRKHLKAGQPWQPFPKVKFAADEQGWLVRSPLVEGGVCNLDDSLAFTEHGEFTLLGRRDRIVKIEEKRVSLSEIERRLLALPMIKDVAVVTLTRGGRTVPGAVVVLQQPHEPLKKLKAQWRDSLSRWLEPVAIPRYWRIVESIPLNSQSKRSWSQLQELFDETP